MEIQVQIVPVVADSGRTQRKRHIRIVSPSGHIDPSLIDSARVFIENNGWRVSEGRYARAEYGRFAGTPEERTSDLLEAFADPSVDVLLCSRGGYGLQQIVDRVAGGLAAIRQERTLPLLVGFSDITCLHSLLGTMGVASVHGLMCKAGTMPADSEEIRLWRSVLEGCKPTYSLPPHPLNRDGYAKGRLTGGNLSVLYGLQGTPWSIAEICRKNKEDGYGSILFIEDICERHYHIDRMMQNLRLSGVLGMIEGLVVGHLTDIEEDTMMPCSVQQTIRQAVEEYDIPLLFGFPAGHDSPNYPLWLNSEAALTVGETGSELTFAC
jgi:muramoyltetrapeptide carboxypeptidase